MGLWHKPESLFVRFCITFFLALIYAGAAPATAADANRLTYLDGLDPYYVSQDFPKLIAPQWVGEPGVDAVIVLSIDDLKADHKKWETCLRPILERLKQIEGRAPVSVMANRVDPGNSHLQTWLKEGLSLEAHTYDHPCPCLAGGDFAKAKSTFDECVDMLCAVPGNRPVAFRMPCCDSINSPSPRFYAEIFANSTPQGRFLAIDSSVFNILTGDDRELPTDRVLEADGGQRFRKYVPFRSYVNTVENYPYPYVIGRTCWEFPCVVPSDWSAQNLQKPANPKTVADWKAALDAVVAKQGVFTLVFHPYEWVRSDQIVELIDYATTKYGRRIKFLNFRDALERLNKNLLAGHSLRDKQGLDAGVRLLDVNADGFVDVVIGNQRARMTRIWSPEHRVWQDSSFPLRIVEHTSTGQHTDAGARFGIISGTYPSVIVRNEHASGAWRFDGHTWQETPELLKGLEAGGDPIYTSRSGVDQGVRLIDAAGSGACQLVVGNLRQNAVLEHNGQGWSRSKFSLPADTTIVNSVGRDAGLRFVDVDEDGRLDVVFSNEDHSSLHLFERGSGWTREASKGATGGRGPLPMIAREGTNNGAWFHSRHMWVQNEDTARMPDLVDRRSFDDLLKNVQPGPKTPAAALKSIKVPRDFTVELMAGDDLVNDPVAFAWDASGRLWVVEMCDYPLGIDGKGAPGGRMRYLEDRDGDGRYDHSTIFLDRLAFPTGVAPWRKGILVTCAPDIFYAEDTDGDGRADKREVLFTGFGEGNQQHRMNGLKWGLDGWLYCANGESGGKIRSIKTGKEVAIQGRDFRIRPDEGLVDPTTGISQFGTTRDDWGNWFGCSNSYPMYHFVLADRYLRRNPHLAAPDPRVQVSETPGPSVIYPRSRTASRFNELQSANRFTSANSVLLYRDDLFGPEFAGNSFVSEPVHNLVHREIVQAKGVTFTSRRAPDEQQSEFLASTDNWFRPTMLATGPDGALWIADMYRLVIEHPEWIPKEWQKRLDLRAGHDLGRIYRVYPRGKQTRPIPRLDQLSTAELVTKLDYPSGWWRDTAQQLLVWRNDRSAVPHLEKLVVSSARPECRVQALCTLDLLSAASRATVLAASADPHPGVRRHAIRIAESHLAEWPKVSEAILKMSADDDPQVQLQLAYSLGEWSDPRAGRALAEMALKYRDDPIPLTAVLSSVSSHNLRTVLDAALDAPEHPTQLTSQLVALAASMEDRDSIRVILERAATPSDGRFAAWQTRAMASLLTALVRGAKLELALEIGGQKIPSLVRWARSQAADSAIAESRRLNAVALLGYLPADRQDDLPVLEGLLVPRESATLQSASVVALARMRTTEAAQTLLAGWRSFVPALRAQVLDVLLSQPQWTSLLLDGIEQQHITLGDIDATRRQRLLELKDAALRKRAERLLAGSSSPDRQKVIDEYAKALVTKGDIQAGAATFTKRCSVCHRLNEVGHVVGPDLSSLSDKSPQFFLTAMLDPNRAVEARYLNYMAITDDGLTHTGILGSETGTSVTLLGQDGQRRVILRTELDELQSTGKSLMPEGLEKDLTPKDVADVIAFLCSATGPARRKLAHSQPEIVRPDRDGVLRLLATNCEVFGTSLTIEGLYKNLGHWTSEGDRAVWTVELPKAARVSVQLNYACAPESEGNEFVIEAGKQQLVGKVGSSGSWDIYREQECGTLELQPGSNAIVLRSRGAVRGALLDLGSIVLEPVE